MMNVFFGTKPQALRAELPALEAGPAGTPCFLSPSQRPSLVLHGDDHCMEKAGAMEIAKSNGNGSPQHFSNGHYGRDLTCSFALTNPATLGLCIGCCEDSRGEPGSCTNCCCCQRGGFKRAVRQWLAVETDS